MVIFAHADDADITSGGSIAKWISHGSEVTYVVCTDGGKGSNSREYDRRAVAAKRRDEQLAAAQILGVTGVIFLDYADGELDRALDLRQHITELIRVHRPQRVVAWDPWRPYQVHRDHTAAGHAAFYGAIEAGIPTYAGTVESRNDLPHQVEEIYLFGTDHADTWEDTSGFETKKRRAIRCHVSQMGGEEQTNELLAWNQEVGRSHNVAYAEEFKVFRPQCEI